jgi:ABC-type transport system substrate-binding protein
MGSMVLSACGDNTATPAAPATTTAANTTPATGAATTAAQTTSAATTKAATVSSDHPGVYSEVWYGPDPVTLDPQASQPGGYTTLYMYGNLYVGLTDYDQNLNIVPGIAKEWKASADSKTWTFTLNPNAKFSSGRQVTADDVAYSFERALDPNLKNARALGGPVGDIVGASDKFSGKATKIAGIKVIDPTTIEFSLAIPTSFYPSKLASGSSAYIVDKDVIAANPTKWWETKSAGAGPFQLSAWQHNQSISLVPNPGWYGSKVKLTQINYLMVGDQTNRLSVFESGKADAHWQLLTAEIDRVSKDKGDLGKMFSFMPKGIAYTYALQLNANGYAPFKDAKVRKAIMMALDSAAINETPLNNAGFVATGLISNGLPAYKPDQMKLKYDPEGAKKLLAEAGYADGSKLPELTLTQVGAGPDAAGTTQFIQEELKTNLGMNVKIDVADQQRFIALSREGKVAAWTGLMIVGYSDPYSMLSYFFSKSPLNSYGYNNPEVDGLLMQAMATQDETARNAIYQQVEAKVLDDAAIMPLMWSKFYMLQRPWVSGFRVNALGIMPYTELEVK